MYMENKEIINKFCTERHLKELTRKSYESAINKYSNFHQKTMHELIIEAEQEEQQNIKWKYSTLRDRLINFRNYLLEEELLHNTVKGYLSRVQTFYENFEIEIGKLPPVSQKNMNKPDAISFNDLPDKELIKLVLKVVSPVMRAIILFMTSSGCAKRETLNLTVESFLKATSEYHNNSDDIYSAIDILKNRDDVVPSWRLKRQKTNKFYTTFSSPESTSEIINYLISEERPLKLDSPLFKITPTYFNNYFTKINNDYFNLGKAGTYNRFRSHMLRKFHASQLYNDGMSMDEIDELQGRGKDPTRTSYFLENPLRLREKYIEHLDAVTINLDVNNLDIKSTEYIQMETELEEKKLEVSELKNSYDAQISSILERMEKLESNTQTSNSDLIKLKRKI